MNKDPYFDDQKRFCHPCCIADCTKEGCIGIGVNLLKGRLGWWYCGPHYRELERNRSKEENKPKNSTPQKPTQGRLF
ncbi:MAG: hypothetical protein H6867_04890 [Rhodospirillales bacterium]|nr:hypothetical protein [Rhodospirillales bacterium]MCB9994837.1 hypothetical protein [Rhodospirillales bacterium]